MFHSQLVEFINPFNDALKMPDVARRDFDCAARARGALDGLVTQQAAVMAYSNDFLVMTFVSLAAFPLLLLLRSSKLVAARRRRRCGRSARAGERRGACGGDGLRSSTLGAAR